MSKRSALKATMLLCVLCVAVAAVWAATTFTTLVSFDQTNGAFPQGYLVQGFNGNLYGTTREGGANTCSSSNGPVGCGTVFEITPAGRLTTLHSFCSQTNCTDGRAPWAGLVQATNGNFYGTTYQGGAYGYGTVFEITRGGRLTTLHSFDATDGALPLAGLVQATNGDFYGTTYVGGASKACPNGCGTVFEITPAGRLTTLHSFDSTDGANPVGGLVQATDRNLYGITYEGGASSACSNGCGTVFEITASGTLTTLHSFDGTDGANPVGGLVQATDRNLYGTTEKGGADGHGTVFEITPAGTLTTLYSFCSQTGCKGIGPAAALLQATNGSFYGTTLEQGTSNTCSTIIGNTVGCGTVFTLSVGLRPFVETLPTSGKVGATVYILGTGLTEASKVSFGGTSAEFTVVSATEIKTSVPSDALTGFVTVTTPTGALKSNKEFRVTPQLLSLSPTSGPVGTPVTITGVSLTQTTKVTFGGVKATMFTVNSDTQVTAKVPTGAMTGHIAITTKGGTAVSSGIFTVTQ